MLQSQTGKIMDELSELTHMLQAQMAGDASVTREQVEKWHVYYPYFSLPLLLYLRQCPTPDTDMSNWKISRSRRSLNPYKT